MQGNEIQKLDMEVKWDLLVSKSELISDERRHEKSTGKINRGVHYMDAAKVESERWRKGLIGKLWFSDCIDHG
jgi:hypothetical protein